MLGLLVLTASLAQAEVAEVRLGKQFGLGHLPLIVIEQQKPIETTATATGLGDAKVPWLQQSGPAVQPEALIAGQLDCIGPGVPTLATIWDRTVSR